ncbi:MAG: hypothetical protein AAB930_00475 [Patescibacteria group bacterium]
MGRSSGSSTPRSSAVTVWTCVLSFGPGSKESLGWAPWQGLGSHESELAGSPPVFLHWLAPLAMAHESP